MKECYAVKPAETEVYTHGGGSDIILRKNIQEVTDEEAGTKWECDERQFRYGTPVSFATVKSNFSRFWALAGGESPLEDVKAKKIADMSEACRNAIIAGFSIALSDGETYRFTMKNEDQIAMTLLLSRAQTGEEALDFYAADRKCLVLSNKDALKIGNAAVAYRSYHVAYYRCLADWIDSLDDAASIGTIEYGAIVPKEFRSGFLVRYATALGVSVYAEIS